ncbi:hypothetical protein [Pseudonocardia zijingensis]|uniref:Uncharacterized protein n=1 Tax=Pseudonocardia zijingensis TaxID=153376 RepID=A0ABN1PN52_9PSEU
MGDDEHAFEAGDIIRIALPDGGGELRFMVSDVRDDGGVEATSLIPDPENADRASPPWER